ncbi:MAG: hypothetical protein EOM68_28585 [Spirochaetia bacterium]|nr:hypothetical protein [Spirochaetia bacterium]
MPRLFSVSRSSPALTSRSAVAQRMKLLTIARRRCRGKLVSSWVTWRDVIPLVPLIHVSRSSAGPWHFGTISKGVGSRNDLDACMEFIQQGGTKRQCYELFPKVAAKHPRFIEQHIKYRVEDETAKVLEVAPRFQWQTMLLDFVEASVDDRQILWIFDEVGKHGKTYLSKYLVDAKGAFYCSGGKGADILFAYNGESTVVFDYARESKDYVNYGVMEQIKNGMLFSAKYESGMKRFNIPRLIVMANFLPDRTKWSRDRYNVYDISKPDDILEMRWEDLPFPKEQVTLLSP